MTQTSISSAAALAEMLAATGYLADDGLATIGYLALSMERPLLLEGEPGTAQNPPDGLVDRRFGFDGAVRGQPAALGPPIRTLARRGTSPCNRESGRCCRTLTCL